MSERKVAVIGGSGFVGQEICKHLYTEGITPVSASRTSMLNKVDITNEDDVDGFIAQFPGDTIILAAAETDGKKAQLEPEKSVLVNRDGSVYVARSAEKHGKHLIFLSTDFVFEGALDNPGPYSEDAKIADSNSNKIGEYARSKVMAENALREMDGEIAIVRISYPFGNTRSQKDLLTKFYHAVEKGYGLYDDQYITPTYTLDLARAIKIIADRKLTGIFHVATSPVTTPYQMGKHLYSEVKKKFFS